MIEFEEHCIAPKTGHHHKRIVNIGGFSKLADRPELVAAKNFWDALFLPHRPQKPLEGPLKATVIITWPWNASDPKKVRARGYVPHHTKPDAVNIFKTIEDSAGRCGFFLNDSQIAELTVIKRRGECPGVYVRLEAEE